jgi:hypothetical protein
MKAMLTLCVLFAIGCVDQKQTPAQDASIPEHVDGAVIADAPPYDYASWGWPCDPSAPQDICVDEVTGRRGWCVQYQDRNVCEPACGFTCPDNGKKNYTQDGLCFCTAN